MSKKLISNCVLFFVLTYLYGPSFLVNRYLHEKFPDAPFTMAGPTVVLGAFASVLAAYAVAYVHKLITQRKTHKTG